MAKPCDGHPESREPAVRLETHASAPAPVRRRLVEEVKRRLLSGELDSDLARVETAFALLDGDRRRA